MGAKKTGTLLEDATRNQLLTALRDEYGVDIKELELCVSFNTVAKWECPSCWYDNEDEGAEYGDQLECQNCGQKVILE